MLLFALLYPLPFLALLCPLPSLRRLYAVPAGKYEYGILALERATECFWESSGRSARYERLVRRVTRITREHGDTKRYVGCCWGFCQDLYL